MASRSERRSLLALTLTLLVLGVTLTILAAHRGWLPEPGVVTGRTPSVPCWVMLGPIEAITEDGSILRLGLALDACDAGSQDAINARRSDLEAIVRVVVAEHRREALEGAAGIQRLREALKLRLSAHVQGFGAEAVRDVVVDQFVLRRI